MTNTQRTQLSALSMFLGLGVSAILCILTGGLAAGGALGEAVDAGVRPTDPLGLPGDELIERPARKQSATELLSSDQDVLEQGVGEPGSPCKG